MNELVPDLIWGTPAVCLFSEDEVTLRQHGLSNVRSI